MTMTERSTVVGVFQEREQAREAIEALAAASKESPRRHLGV
jgi:hypothetical protein